MIIEFVVISDYLGIFHCTFQEIICKNITFHALGPALGTPPVFICTRTCACTCTCVHVHVHVHVISMHSN